MINQYISEFLALVFIHLLAVISPGPDFALTVSQSVKSGRKAGIYIAIGIGAGMSVHIIYTILGVGALMHASPTLMGFARVLGGGYVIYLALKLLGAKPCNNLGDSEILQEDLENKWSRIFWMGFLTNATNPKATLFFLAIFTTLVSSSTPIYIQAVYGIWMCFINALWFSMVATFFAHPGIRNQFLKMGYWFERLMGVLLLLFAMRLIWGFLD